MSANMFYRWGLRWAGSLLLVIGAGHLLLPSYGYSPEVSTGWSAEAKDHFLYLATYMIAAFLFTLSLLSFIYSTQRPSRPIAWFATISTILWIVRLFLEIKFPVTVKIFFVDQPYIILMAVLGVIIASYALAASVAWGMLLIKK